MTKYLWISLLVCLVSATVPQLTITNAQGYVDDHEVVFVKFFSPRCGHCVAMAPEYEKLHKQSQGKKYKIVEVDCSKERLLCGHQHINGFPTLRLYAYGSTIDYQEERTAQIMANWIEDLLSSSLSSVDPQVAKSKIGSQTFVLISGQNDKNQKVIAMAHTKSLLNINFYTHSSSTQFIRLYTKGNTEYKEYTIDDDFPKSLINWSFEQGRPSVIQFNNKILNFVHRQEDYEYILVIVDQQDTFSASVSSPLRIWCDNNRKDILCLSVSKQSEVYQQIKQLTQSSEQKTTISILKRDLNTGYHFQQQSLTVESLTKFFQDAKQDKIYRSIDEQRERKDKFKSDNIVKLSLQNYNSTITENEIVFIEYYSPYCGHCVKFASNYDQLAAYYKKQNSKVVIAAVDVSQENDISEQQDIQGFPTFKLYIRGTSLKYNQGRKVESMVKFIDEVSNTQLLTSQTLQNIAKPFIAIRGIDSKSILNSLPALFSTYPIYHITDEAQFSIVVYNSDTTKKYKGGVNVDQIVDWLIDASSPVLVSLGQSIPSKKLEKAVNKKIPILVVLNKHERQVAAPALNFLTQYCKDITEFVCGYVHKGEPDYQDLIEWSGDKDLVTNRLAWIEISGLKKYIYPGNPNEVTKESLDKFIAGIRGGSIPEYDGAEVIEESEDTKETQQRRQSLEQL